MEFCQFAFVIFFVTTTLAYDPDRQNVYHLYTRLNPTASQRIIPGDTSLLKESNFNPDRRTAFIIHGWLGSAASDVNKVLVPAYLQADDINVFVVDWGAGSNLLAGGSAPENAVASGRSVAGFIDWLVDATGLPMEQVQVVGHSLGAHQAAVAGRSVTRGRIPYIVALDPGANMEASGHMFGPDAATYTEAIHTNALVMGHGYPLAHVDFYPNGGNTMPGCSINFLCSHNRSFYYFGESLSAPQGFRATFCESYRQARQGACRGPTLPMGGLSPKPGYTGLYYLETNARAPFRKT